jgi:hypothetical protein
LPARSALVTGYLLPGGTHQIFVTGNYNDAQGNGIAFGGFCFSSNGTKGSRLNLPLTQL